MSEETKEVPDRNTTPKKRAARKPKAAGDKMDSIISDLEKLMGDSTLPKVLDVDLTRVITQCKAIKFIIAAK